MIAIDSKTGRPVWNIEIADPKFGYSLTLAPLIIKDKVVVGTAGGEYGIRGFIAAYDARTGKEAWRFKTIPEAGEPGSPAPTIPVSTSPIGAPATPVPTGTRTIGTATICTAIAWYFQFKPSDGWDYDAVQIPVLIDMPRQGTPRKLMLWANRNGFFYVLDRVTGQFLLGKPFVKQTWAKGLDDKGRPIRIPSREGTVAYPGVQGCTN